MQPESVNSTLFEIAEAVFTTNSLRELFDKFHFSLKRILPNAFVQIALFDALDPSFQSIDHLYPGSGTSEKAAALLTDLSISLSAEVASKGKPLFLDQAEVNSFCFRNKVLPTENPPTSWLGFPIKIKSQSAGVIILQNFSREELFSKKDVQLFCSLADQLAIGIDRHRNQIKYQNLLENIKDLVFTADGEGRFTYLGSSSKSITGYSTAELLNQRHWQTTDSSSHPVNTIIHAEDREYLTHILQSSYKGMTRYQAEYRMIKKDGTLRWVSEKGRFYQDHSGKTVLDGVITDIHDRRKAELVNKVLYTISNAVNSTRHQSELFTVIHETLNQLISIEHFGIGLYDPQNDSINFTYNFDLSQTQHPLEIKQVTASNMLPAEVIRSSNLVYLTRADLPVFEAKLGQEIFEGDFEAWLGVPLRVNNTIIGVMFSEIHNSANVYTQEDIECFLSVADQVAIALDRKKIEEKINFREKIITTLYKISNAIHRSSSLYQLYNSIHEALSPALYTDTLTLAFYDRKTDTLHFHYSADQVDLTMLDPIENVSKSNSLTYCVIKTGNSLLLNTEQKSALRKKLGGKMIGSVESKCWLGVPIKGKDEIIGVIVNQSYTDQDCYNQKDIQYLETVSEQIAFAIEYKRAEANLASTQKALLDKAHKAGMADIASDTIHNLGATLDKIKSINNTIKELLAESQLSNFSNAIKLVKEKQNDLKSYFSNSSGGKTLMQYLLGLKQPLNHEYNQLQFQNNRIAEKIALMTDIIRKQQNHVYEGSLEEESTIEDIVSHVLDSHQSSLRQNEIDIIRNFDDIPKILVNRSKLRHIIMNLIENARDAMCQTENQNRLLSVTLSQNTSDIYLVFRDNGDGIEAKNLNKIFAHGFTTKPNGHGFGLHNCANLAMSMQGTLWAISDGPGKGATFTLKFPKR